MRGNGGGRVLNTSEDRARLIGEQASDYAGCAVDAAGDVNGDGFSTSSWGRTITLPATDLSVTDTEGVGLGLIEGSSAICSSCDISNNRFAGVLAFGQVGLLLDEGTQVRLTSADRGLGGGVGVLAGSNLSSPDIHLDDVVIADSSLAAIALEGPGSYQIERSTLESGTEESGNIYPGANALFAFAGIERWSEDEQTGLLLSENTWTGATDAAIFLDASSATLEDQTWETSGGLQLFQQSCADISSPEGTAALTDIELCPDRERRIEVLEYYLYESPLESER